MAWAATRSLSTKVARAAPRDSASRPIAPEPANRSRTSMPSTGPIRLKAASRTRSPVGRVSRPPGAKIRVPLREPAMIRIGEEPVDLVRQGPLLVDELGGPPAGANEKPAIPCQACEAKIGKARLPRPEQLAFSPQLEVDLGEAEPVGGLDERFETPPSALGKLVSGARDEQAIRLLGPSPY